METNLTLGHHNSGNSHEIISRRVEDGVERDALFAACKRNLPHELLPTEIIKIIFHHCNDDKKVYLPICYDCSTMNMP
jgi:hypothetical protein